MNKKIEELAEQAGYSLKAYYNSADNYQTPKYKDEILEKFAELIIKECIYQVELTWMNQNGWSRNDDCVQSIKQKFGIKW